MSDALRALVRGSVRGMVAYDVPRPPGIRANLAANESPYPLGDDAKASLLAALSAVDPHRYPDAHCANLRAVVADDMGVDPASLVFGNGSDELIAMLVAAFGAPRPGESAARVLYPVPTFGEYRTCSYTHSADVVEVPTSEGFALDGGALEAAMRDRRPNLAFFARPNNPTGTLWDRGVIERLIREFPDVLVIVDEAYIDYGGDSFLPLRAELPNLVIMRTLSKIGMAGLRVGFLTADPWVVGELEKVRPPYNLTAYSQAAATHLLATQREAIAAHCREVAAERGRVRAALDALDGLEPFDSEANLIIVRVADSAGAEGGEPRAHGVWRRLAERGVLVRKFGAGSALGSFLRISIGTPGENDLLLASLPDALSR